MVLLLLAAALPGYGTTTRGQSANRNAGTTQLKAEHSWELGFRDVLDLMERFLTVTSWKGFLEFDRGGR